MRFSLSFASVALASFALAAPPPELAYVPADALAFAHADIGDTLLNHTALGENLRTRPDLAKAFAARYPISIADLQAVAVFGRDFQAEEGPAVTAVVRFGKPVDWPKMKEFLLPNGREVKHAGQTWWVDESVNVAIARPTPTIVAVATATRLEAAWVETPAVAGPLKPAITAAATNKLTLAVNAAALPKEALTQVPPPVQPVVQAKLAMVSIPADAKTIQLSLRYADAEAASSAELAVQQGVLFGRQQLQQLKQSLVARLGTDPGAVALRDLLESSAVVAGLGGVAVADEVLQKPLVTRTGATLEGSIPVVEANPTLVVAAGAVGVGLMLPAVQKVRVAAAMTKSSNNMKMIGLAMHSIHDVQGQFPAHAIYSKDGKKPLLSWRVAILPYLEQETLYKQFKLDEPWDSEHNKSLIAKMPNVYLNPQAADTDALAKDGKTHYLGFAGDGALFARRAKGLKIQDITDGTSNTVMVAESRTPVIWTKPDDFDTDPQKPLPKFGVAEGKPFYLGFCDGSVRSLPPTIKEKTLRALITVAGGEVVDEIP